MSGKKTAKSVYVQDGYRPSNKLNVNNPPSSGSAIPLPPISKTNSGKINTQTFSVNHSNKPLKR